MAPNRDSAAIAARWDRIGNAHAANALVLKARAAWRVADSIRRDADGSEDKEC